jgi:hypothetical protein
MFSALEAEDVQQLEEQRQLVRNALAKLRGLPHPSAKVTADDLQAIVDAKVFGLDEVWELQCLGVCLGDLLCERDNFRWVICDDEYGRDPTVRIAETTMQLNALTLIQKRVQSGEDWRVTDLTEDLPRIALKHLAEQGLL